MNLRPLTDVAAELGLSSDHLLPFGRDKAKISLDALSGPPTGRGGLILVSAINPTSAGEGKTTVSISLAMGLRRIGQKVALALREPSLGPVFGMKGGATGGGAAQIQPAEAINLHFTGDIHAVGSAHNTLAALVDNDLHWGSTVGLDPRKTTWGRALDVNDRSLRGIVTGLGGEGVPRESRFDITAASEVMAILCLATSVDDLQTRLAAIRIGRRADGSPVTAGELGGAAAMAALLREALLPNLVQTNEGGPAFVHGGPFANIAHGCSSLLATRMARQHADWTVTEAGFGFDLGGEKFLDIKCRVGGLWPDAVVLVATLRALRAHGGAAKPADPDADALSRGLPNLARHVETAQSLGLRVVVALNVFGNDPAGELQTVADWCRDNGVACAQTRGFTDGGAGAVQLAETVVSVGSQPRGEPKYVYPLDASYADKLDAVARKVYGADGVRLGPGVAKTLERFTAEGNGHLPICIAKTQYSLTDDAKRLGRPSNFSVTVREVRLAAGAGFVVALLGDILTMPGLPRDPAAYRVKVWPDGRVTGLMQGD